jgi:hypothetical protein
LKYVIVLVCLFFTQSKEGVQICEPCKNTKNKGLEVVAKYKNSLDINVEPSRTCVRKVQITCCEHTHRCTKEQACLGEFGFIL